MRLRVLVLATFLPGPLLLPGAGLLPLLVSRWVLLAVPLLLPGRLLRRSLHTAVMCGGIVRLRMPRAALLPLLPRLRLLVLRRPLLSRVLLPVFPAMRHRSASPAGNVQKAPDVPSPA